MKNKLFRIKPHHAHEYEGHELKRSLNALNLITLGIGAIIGAGIFVLTGQAAAQYAGPAIVISFIISGIACAFAGLCYAEFASLIPVSGSAYTYAYATMGELMAWIIGWDLILEYLFAASTVAVGWSGYMISILNDIGIHIPVQYTAATGTTLIQVPDIGWRPITPQLKQQLIESGIAIQSLPHVTAWFNLPAVFIIAVITILLVLGIKESARFNNIMVIIKVGVILLFIIVGFFFVKASNWTPFIPDKIIDEHGHSHYGIFGILRAAGVIFFAYIGFDAVSTAAQEAKNPQRDMPKGILGSLGVSTVLYILVALVLTGIVSYTHLNVADPIAVGVNAMGPQMMWLRPIIKLAAIAGLTSVILVMIMGQSRIFYTMAKDGLLPPTFSKVHHKFKTPYKGTIITGSIAMIIGGVLPINILGEMVSIGTLLAFVIVCFGIIILRRTKPNLYRPFRTPLVPLIPLLGAGFCFLQMVALPLDTWLRLIIWMFIGFIIYFTYGIKHSKLHGNEPL